MGLETTGTRSDHFCGEIFDTLTQERSLALSSPMRRESIDELYARWKNNPETAETAALCHALRGARRPDLVEIVGNHAARQLDVGALLAAGRMYTDSGRLEDAQSVLLSAGKLAPRDSEVYRWLGEVLLRRGDADRAEKVLEKAVQFGAADDAHELLERARGLVPTQLASGTQAVAQAVATWDAPQTSANAFDALPSHGARGGPKGAPLPTDDALPGASAATPFGSVGLEPPSSRAESRPRVKEPEPPINPALLRPPPVVGGASIPEARDVLDALQIAGIYEPNGAVGPQAFTWAKPERVSRVMGAIVLVVLALGLVGGGIGTYVYVTDTRAKAHVEAEALLSKVDKDLQASDPALLEPAEQAISRAFELESRSPHAALTWLHERAIVGLLRGGADLAFEDSTQRAKAVGIEEKRVAFAYVASFLFQGDTAGAAATIAKWDNIAQDDPWFQLLAAATFERAGDPRALERYGAVAKLDPELVIAQVLLARATAVDGDPRQAADLAKDFRARHPERAEGSALVALTWTRDPLRGDEPPEIKEVTEKG
ncbi:MAG TPA: tetratricopeptide repeat protein, partial [Labilithrix sp.]|nr:tetratricopeptide repeat protein [Labilithrix sp.]